MKQITPISVPVRTVFLADNQTISMRIWDECFETYFEQHRANGLPFNYETMIGNYVGETAGFFTEVALAHAKQLASPNYPAVFLFPPYVQPGASQKISPDVLLSSCFAMPLEMGDLSNVIHIRLDPSPQSTVAVVLLRESVSSDSKLKVLHLSTGAQLDKRVESVRLVRSFMEKPVLAPYPLTRILCNGEIWDSHTKIAKLVSAEAVWIVDEDNTDLIRPRFIPEVLDHIYVWESRNPYNGLSYGHGAPKIFPTKVLREASRIGSPADTSDFTMWCAKATGCGLEVIPETVSTHSYGVNERSGVITSYREGWKLACIANRLREYGQLVPDHAAQEAHDRLEIWIDPQRYNAPYRYMSAAAKFGALEAMNPKVSAPINNQKFLEGLADHILKQI